MVALPILGETLELTLAIELGAGDLLPGSGFELYILDS
jgi:hypothetical protein